MNDMSKLKPPYDEDAEKSILSCMIIDRDALIKTLDIIEEDDFYIPAHRTIFLSCKTLFERSEPVDFITVKTDLTKKKLIQQIGGEKTLNNIFETLPITTNVDYYAKIIKESSTRRKIITLSSDFVQLGMNEILKIEDILDDLESKIFNISQTNKVAQFADIKDIIMDVTDKIENPSDELLKGLQTGFSGLDDLLGGFYPGDLIIIAARPSVGKTAIMLEIARYMSVVIKKRLAIFSLEMSKEQLAQRLIALQSEINLMNIKMGNLSTRERDVFYAAADDIYQADIFIDDTPGQHINEIKSKIRKFNLKNKLDAIFIDYLQLLKGRNTENRALEVSEISQGLKNIGKEIGVPVIALSQLNRAVESRTDRKPQLSDLRESGSIEQDADIVMFVHREAVFNRDIEEENKDKAELIVAKHRNGATGIINLQFVAEQAKFRDAPGDTN